MHLKFESSMSHEASCNYIPENTGMLVLSQHNGCAGHCVKMAAGKIGGGKPHCGCRMQEGNWLGEAQDLMNNAIIG